MKRPTGIVRYTVLAVSLVYALVLHLAGFQVDGWAKRVISLLPAIATGSLMLWDVLLWRLPGVHRLTHRPRLDGLWRVTLSPTDESHIPTGGNKGPIPAYFVIRQSYWSVHVRQYTAESVSMSRAFFWDLRPGTDVELLAFLYDNDPKEVVKHRSPRHLGSCTLDVTSRCPTEMSGAYFTDRYTKGDVQAELVDRSREHASFSAADRHADAASKP